MSNLVDLEVLKAMQEMSPDDPDFVFAVIDSFLNDVRPRLEELRSQQANGQAEAMGHTAHALASSVLNMGLGPLAKLCSTLDRLGRSGKLEGSGELVEQIAEAFLESNARLEQIMKSRSVS